VSERSERAVAEWVEYNPAQRRSVGVRENGCRGSFRDLERVTAVLVR
jgi:hypothetical protein